MKKLNSIWAVLLGCVLFTSCEQLSVQEITAFTKAADSFLTSHYQRYDSAYFEREDGSIEGFEITSSDIVSLGSPEETERVDENGETIFEYNYDDINVALFMVHDRERFVRITFAANKKGECYHFQIEAPGDYLVPIESGPIDFRQDTLRLSNSLYQQCWLTRERGIIFLADSCGHTWTALER